MVSLCPAQSLLLEPRVAWAMSSAVDTEPLPVAPEVSGCDSEAPLLVRAILPGYA